MLKMLGLTAGAVAIPGCVPGRGPSQEEASPSSTSQTGGATGDLVIADSEGEPANLDATTLNAWSLLSSVGSAVHASLLYLSASGTLEPDLATGYEVQDETTIRFDLRDSVTFHNGKSMTAEDVKASLERLLDPATGSAYTDLLQPIESVEAPDSTTALIHLSRPYPALPALLSEIPIIPVETANGQANEPIGAGPFRFARWEQDNFIEFERYEDYHDDGFPRIQSYRYVPRTDAASLRAGFEAGEYNIASGITWADREQLGGETDYINGFTYVALNGAEPPFDDPNVRRAMNMIINRQQFAETANGPGAESNGLFIAESSPFYPEGLDVEYDPERAADLLAQAGIAEGTEFEAVIVDAPIVRPIAPVWEAAMEEVGLRLNTLFLPPADFIDRVFVNSDFQMGLAGDASPPDPSLLLDRYLKTDGATNFTNYSNPRMDEILETAGTTYDEGERKTLYEEAVGLLIDDGTILPFQQSPVNIVQDDAVSGFAVRPNHTYEIRSVELES